MSEYINWRLDTDDQNILWCYIDVPDRSLNLLSLAVIEELEHIIRLLESEPPAGFILLSGKETGFIAGADVHEFTRVSGVDEAHDHARRVQGVFDRIEALICPTVCAINGVCLGGGLELALAFDYRLALDDARTRIGLPEVLLGIHPGFGGSVRFIRQVGPVQGLQLMLAGKSVNARTASRLGLVDHHVPRRQFKAAARQLIGQQPPRSRPRFYLRLLNKAPLRWLLASGVRRQLRKKIRQAHYPAPYALLGLWQQHGGDERAMLAAEADSVAELINSTTSRNLVRVFLLQEQLKSAGKAPAQTFDAVHVIGAGVMGGDIAAWCACQGLNVSLQDKTPALIAPAVQRAVRLFQHRLKRPRQITAARDRLLPDVAGSAVARADVIIEAIVEDAESKAQLFSELLPKLKAGAILATNTSSIGLDRLGGALADPGRLVGIHFFNPVAQMQLVEVIYSPATEKPWIDAASAFCRRINRLPLPVKSSPGFLINRILSAYMNETMILLEEGIQAELIDKVAVDFGMPLGPVELADTVGLDICLSVNQIMADEMAMPISDTLSERVAQGHTGKKAGRGFYHYKKNRPVKRQIATPTPDLQTLEDRLVLRILNACAACLREQLVETADLLDAGMIFGTGFAPFRGGPMHYAKHRGIASVVARLESLQAEHGRRFTPDSYWDGMAGSPGTG